MPAAPENLVLHGILGEEQLGGASADAQSYWQGRFAACTFVERVWHTGRPWNCWGVAPNPTRGRCPLTLQGADEKGRSPPLDPFSRLSWSHFHAPSACSFLVLRLSPCLLPQLSVKNRKFSSAAQNRLQNRRFYAILFCACRNGGMADATDSKSVGSDVVGGQVPLPARHEESESDFPIGSGFGFFLAFPSGNTVIIRRSIC